MEDARRFFEDIWSKGDYWQLATSAYDQGRFDAQLALLADRRYARALEYGCGAGEFTRRLAAVADAVVAVDVAANAVEQARAVVPENVELRLADAVEFDPVTEGPFDLVVLGEVVYYIGWLRTFFEVGWFAHRVFEATAPGGRALLGNTLIHHESSLESPWLVHTYRDLLRNVGFEPEREETYRNEKDGVELETLLTLFRKP